MASRNERRRRSRQRAAAAETQQIERREADHDDIVDATAVRIARRTRSERGTTQLIIRNADGDTEPERIEKAEAESRVPKKQAGALWDPDKIIQPPINPTALWTIYETNAIHSGAINAKVADSVGRGWQLTAKDQADDADASDITGELTEVLREVCTDLTFAQLVRQAVTELEAIGWADWEILRENAGDITSPIIGILPVPAHTVRATKGNDNVFAIRRGEAIVYFKRFGYEPQVSYKTGAVDNTAEQKEEGGPRAEQIVSVPEDECANELVHFKHYTPRSPWYGIPPWVAALPPIAEMTAMREFNVSYFESGGMADRHVHVSSKDDQVAKELADKIIQQLEDARGSAHTSVVTHSDAETEVEVNSLEPKSTQARGKESAFLEGKESCTEEILTAHGVPPYRLAIAKVNSLGGNVADSMDDDYRYGTVEPLQEIVEAELDRTIFGAFGLADLIAGWEFSFNDKTPDDTSDEHERVTDDVQNGVQSPNDARKVKGLDPVEDPAMDEHYMNGQRITNMAGPDKSPAALLAELKAALEAAIGAATGKSPADAELDAETEIDPNDEADATYVTESRGGVFRKWKTLRRR